jgi:hypothetical protein
VRGSRQSFLSEETGSVLVQIKKYIGKSKTAGQPFAKISPKGLSLPTQLVQDSIKFHKKTSGELSAGGFCICVFVLLMRSGELNLPQPYRFKFDIPVGRSMLLKVLDDFEHIVVNCY